ncbi:hypothetical protein RJ640_024760 [Escallonia rubra]|uniref:General transcription and DNA repair factor IIH subunit TFB4 n=1 Tax=Escallonia rubra TaxID=112253 RepID=A0AA88R188_9ASTE|nr:hypothetical protein RJ640_024760 [Escallonia rubra]
MDRYTASVSFWPTPPTASIAMGNSLTKLITTGGRYCVCMDPLMGLDSMLSISFLAVTTISAPQGFTQRYVAIMNAIFSAQRSMVPIDSCLIGAQHSAFLQQVAYNLYWDLYILAAKASYITGGVYLKPQLPDGLFQYLSTVFATDMQSRSFLQLPKPVGVDFRASYELLF